MLLAPLLNHQERIRFHLCLRTPYLEMYAQLCHLFARRNRYSCATACFGSRTAAVREHCGNRKDSAASVESCHGLSSRHVRDCDHDRNHEKGNHDYLAEKSQERCSYCQNWGQNHHNHSGMNWDCYFDSTYCCWGHSNSCHTSLHWG